MGFGDWNDALNGIDRDGRGQLVWTTIAFIFGLRNLSALLIRLNDSDAGQYLKRADELTKIVNEKFFENDRYMRAVTDAGLFVGSKNNDEGRIYIEPQGWTLFSGVADPDKAAKILSAVKKELYVPYGVLLLSPPYTQYHADIGRITNDSPGLVENGSNYVHGSLFFAYGLARAGYPDESYDILCSILPINPENPPELSFLEPFQITNSFRGLGANHPGRAMFSWRTGAAGWFLRTIWDGLLGISPGFDYLVIDAHIPQAFGDDFSAVRQVRGRLIKFYFQKNEGALKKLPGSITVHNGAKIKYTDLSKINSVIIQY